MYLPSLMMKSDYTRALRSWLVTSGGANPTETVMVMAIAARTADYLTDLMGKGKTTKKQSS